MTQTDSENRDNPSTQSGPVWILWLIAGALVLGCVVSLGALFFLRQAGNLDWIQNRRPLAAATATQVPTPAPTQTAPVVVPSPTPRATSTPTSSPSPTTMATATATATTIETATAAATATQTATNTPTQTATATATAKATMQPTTTPTWTPTLATSPTPFVCDSVYTLANIELAPEQTFSCSLQEQELTDLANSYPESPCSETRFTFDDGEIGIECRIGMRMKATLEAKIKDCRIEIEIVKGTPGFKQIVKELIATQFDVIQYDTICINQADVDDGELIVGGYGR